jgi:hypothetical protein
MIGPGSEPKLKVLVFGASHWFHRCSNHRAHACGPFRSPWRIDPLKLIIQRFAIIQAPDAGHHHDSKGE